MGYETVFEYIKTQQNNWKTQRIALTRAKDWNMAEHIERCTAVANAWFFTGQNDGLRPYTDIVTPIINVAFRSEGFDVKDIVPYVNSVSDNYKSFIVKKLHPQWARKNQLDTLIDDVVETSVIYDLVLLKKIPNKTPELINLQTLAFCDQTDVMAGPICIKHQYTVSELLAFRGTWDDDAIEKAILYAQPNKTNSQAGEQQIQTPSKYIEVYELRGRLPKKWIDELADMNDYVDQMQIVCFCEGGEQEGLTLFSGIDKPLSDNFQALKIDRIRSRGRACGRSIVESLFEPQVWTNYSGIKIKNLLDSAVTLFQTDSEEYRNQKLSSLSDNTILTHETNKPITRVDGNLQNLPAFQNYQISQENNARIVGSASDAQLGTNPVSGTPFALQSLIVQQGQGIHEYRQGKIATFFADIIYPNWVLPDLIDYINTGVKFSEELSLDETQEIVKQMVDNEVYEKISKTVLETGIVPTQQEKEIMVTVKKEELMKKIGKRGFFETVKDELKDIPVEVFVNIKGKQKYMAQNADKLTNLIREVVRNPQVFQQIPGLSKVYNELLENSGLSAIDFSSITTTQQVQPVPVETGTPVPAESPLPTQ
jgi:hypothetical protein